MYWSAILWFLTWPLVIVISFFLVQYVVTKYKDRLEHIENGND